MAPAAMLSHKGCLAILPQRAAPGRRPCVVRAAQTAYQSPSSKTAASELQALERYSEVVPDVLLSQTLQTVEAPKAATSSRSVLAGIMANPASFARYKFSVDQARFYDACAALPPAERTACQVDKALANVGALMLENVSGRVSTEVDPRAANDAAQLLARGRRLTSFYDDLGVPRDRVLLRMPATWAAVQAARTLEAEGIACHMVLVYAFVQAAAAAQAGVSVVQPNVGRLCDWFDKHPGALRDHLESKEAPAIARAGYGAARPNPGLLLVEKIYNYCASRHPATKVMASGLRSTEEALALAGCDYLVVGPKVLSALSGAATLEGYNDGLHAGGAAAATVEPALTREGAAAAEFSADEAAAVGEAAFAEGLGAAGRELLEEGVRRLVEDANRLEPMFLNLASGQE